MSDDSVLPSQPTQSNQDDNIGERPYSEPTSAASPTTKNMPKPEEVEQEESKTSARNHPDASLHEDDDDSARGALPSATGGMRRDRELEPTAKGGAIQVKFDGAHWCVEDSSLDHPLQFEHLADAEQRAAELGKSAGRSVCVSGQDGEVIAAYAAPKPAKPSMR